MASRFVPPVASALGVVRVREGGSLSGRCIGVGVPVLVHWSGSKSVPCVSEFGECPSCVRGNNTQWQAFFPIQMSAGVVKLILLGARSLRMGSISSSDGLVGRDCVFRRPKGRRFVEIGVGLEVHPVRELDAHGPVAVLFGCNEFLVDEGDDRIERAYFERCKVQKMASVQ